MDLEGIMLSEINQRKSNTVYHLYMESEKYEKLVDMTKKKQMQTHVTHQRLPLQGGGRRGNSRGG